MLTIKSEKIFQILGKLRKDLTDIVANSMQRLFELLSRLDQTVRSITFAMEPKSVQDIFALKVKCQRVVQLLFDIS
jgi:hypothetical protein